MTKTYELSKYKVATRMANEGFPVDYEVRCPSGAVLCFANEGSGGPDYLVGWKPTGKGKMQPANGPDARDAERSYLLWTLTTPVVVSHMNKFDGSYPDRKYDRAKPAVDLAAIWAEDQGAELAFQQGIAKTIKRTVAYVLPEMPKGEFGYLRVKRGQKVDSQWRADAAAYLRKKYPTATVFGEVTR